MKTTDFWNGVGTFLVQSGWNLLAAAAIIGGAFLLSWILRVLIRRVVGQIVSGVRKKQNGDDTQAIAASPLAAVRVVQRTRTLGTVLSNIINVTVAVVAAILVIDRLAPNVIGSLALLTAVVGAGLGFGAQNIVRDVLNGLLMVMEDQLGVGDVVDLGPATGVVEEVGIRITKVRDVNGTLWFVRNGEILRVGNMSHGWARVIIDLAVPYEADVEAVQEKMLETANALASDPKWRSRIIEKPEIWGLESISAEALVIRLVIKTRTNVKDDVARELRIRLKSALDGMGIKLPALNSIVLSGFEGAASVKGARPPRTRPATAAEEPAQKKPRARGAKAVADPRGVPVVSKTPPITKSATAPTTKPTTKPATNPEATPED